MTSSSTTSSLRTNDTRLIVGIDLGTTHSVMAWAEPTSAGGETPSTQRHSQSAPIQVFAVPQLVSARELGERPLLPSFLYAPAPEEGVTDPVCPGPWIAGEHARRRGEEVPKRLISSAKSWLSHSGVDRLAPVLPWGADEEGPVPRLSPVAASSRLLAHLRSAWDQAHPGFPLAKQNVILTVPASFDPVARQLTLTAAKDAGLEVRLLEEPQAAFYDHLASQGSAPLIELLKTQDPLLVLVCDVGGGTTDLTLIQVTRENGALDLTRLAVGRHLLLGGDNMDLALAHLVEPRLVSAPERLDPQRFSELVLACRRAKETLLGEGAPDELTLTVLGRGSSLFSSSLNATLTRAEVENLILEGFMPTTGLQARPRRTRGGLTAFGLPYEQDPAITRHVADFLARHGDGKSTPQVLLLNGGVFHSKRLRERIQEVVGSLGHQPPALLDLPTPDLSVARGAVAFGLAIAGQGTRIKGGSAHGYYVGLERGDNAPAAALAVVPRGAQESERHRVSGRPLALRIGQPVRFDLYASDDDLVHAPGEVLELDLDRLQPLPPVTTLFEGGTAGPQELRVFLEGELTPIGTVELACVETEGSEPRRFQLAFDLRARGTSEVPERRTQPPRPSTRILSPKLLEALEALQRVFGKSRSDLGPREAKDLMRTLEKILGERPSWTIEVNRALFDELAPKHKSRRRSADHERLFWMLAGYCLRPGFGHPKDPERVAGLAPLFSEGLAFPQETRGWQQFFIAFRRIAAGLREPDQEGIRDLCDPFLAPAELKLKRPKGFRPAALGEILTLCSWLERVPFLRRGELGRWILERTWTDRDPHLWTAIGRLGARIPAYASAHHVVPPSTVERWVDHLLREKWPEVPTAAQAAVQMVRLTGDRSRDLSDAVRGEVEKRLAASQAPEGWLTAVREVVPLEEAERAALFDEDLPVGLRLLENERPEENSRCD